MINVEKNSMYSKNKIYITQINDYFWALKSAKSGHHVPSYCQVLNRQTSSALNNKIFNFA